MKVSLIVATINRVDPLRRLLSSLAVQTCPEFQLLIADQNPPGFIDGLLEEFKPVMDLTSFSIPNQGVSRARNALLPYAKGDIIGFPDDDCFYAPDTVQKLIETFDNHAGLHGIMGAWGTEAGIAKNSGALNAESPYPIGIFSVFRHGETYVQFYRRDVVRVVGEFDPLLGPGTGLPHGCGEDTDYALRVLKSGLAIARAPQVRIFHPGVDLDTPNLKEKVRLYALGRMRLLKKHHFSLWQQILHVFYPLMLLPFETLPKGRNNLRYRWCMFWWRLKGFFTPFP